MIDGKPKAILDTLIERYPLLRPNEAAIREAYVTLQKTYKNGGKVLICGNGGSAADSQHITGELMKGFLCERRIPDAFCMKLKDAYGEAGEQIGRALQCALPAISLTAHESLMTAYSNDCDHTAVFAQQVYGYGKAGDALIVLSTSGESANILNAVMVAEIMGIKTVALTGNTGGRLTPLCDVSINIAVDETYQVQEYHLPVYHALCAMLEVEFFGDNK